MSLSYLTARAILAGGLLALWFASPARASEWEQTVTPFAPGNFPEPRPVVMTYSFGWNGMSAAKGDLRFSKTPEGRFRFDATGETFGMAGTLWPYSVKHTALSDAATRPLQVKETETFRSKEFTTALAFTPEGVTSVREERRGSETKSKTRRFEFPNVLSLNSSLLYLRTQPLANGSQHRIIVYPATSAYLCTITVKGRDRVTVPTGTYSAIKVDLQLSKIGKKRELLPHKKFQNATVWLSDDPDRLVLRIEAKIFIGTVFAELQSAQFESSKP